MSFERVIEQAALEREVIAAQRRLYEAALAYGRSRTVVGAAYEATEALHEAAEALEVAHENRERARRVRP